MQLINADHMIGLIKEMDNDFELNNLTCWEKKEENYSVYIFSVQYDTELDLINCHDELRDYIAIYFQSQILEKEVEKWNLYQVYFVKDNVEMATKLKVEQDKFSTRKIVKSGFEKTLTNEEISNAIYSELFMFNVSDRDLTTKSLEDVLDDESRNTINLISKYSVENSKKDLNKIIEELNCE